MIQLFSRHILIKDRNGLQIPFSFDDIRGELFACFQDCGVTEEWAAEHIVLVLEEQFVGAPEEAERIATRQELDQLVLAILRDAGFADVAAAYSRRRGGVAASRQSPSFEPWDTARLERVLKTVPLADGTTARDRIRETGEALQTLRLTCASDELIRQLGMHGRGRDAGQADAALLPRHDLPAPAKGACDVRCEVARDLIEQGVIRPHRVSPYLPRVRLDLSLDRLVDEPAAAPLLPLLFFPRLREASRIAGIVLNKMRELLCRDVPHAAAHPAHVVVLGMDTVVNDGFRPGRPDRACTLQAEILQWLEREIPQALAFDVIVTQRA